MVIRSSSFDYSVYMSQSFRSKVSGFCKESSCGKTKLAYTSGSKFVESHTLTWYELSLTSRDISCSSLSLIWVSRQQICTSVCGALYISSLQLYPAILSGHNCIFLFSFGDSKRYFSVLWSVSLNYKFSLVQIMTLFCDKKWMVNASFSTVEQLHCDLLNLWDK